MLTRLLQWLHIVTLVVRIRFRAFLSGRWVVPKTRTEGSGDFSRFFVEEVHRYGGKTLGLDSVSKIEAGWELLRDGFGFQVHLFGPQFAQVSSLLWQLLGEPIQSGPNTHARQQELFDPRISGMHIQVADEESRVYIVAVGLPIGAKPTATQSTH